jgi:hypothetical protein
MTTDPKTQPRARKARAPEGQIPAPTVALPKGKLGMIIGLMARPQGATLADLMTASGWQAHSVRGVIAGAIKKKIGLTVLSEKPGNERIYRIAEGVSA